MADDWMVGISVRGTQQTKKKKKGAHTVLGRLLYIALSFVDKSVKKSLARSTMQGSSSSRHLAISLSWPLTLIMPFRMRCMSTVSVFFFMMRSMSKSPQYSSSLFSSMIVLNNTATSLSAIAMLLQMFKSFDVSRIWNSRWWFARRSSGSRRGTC